MSAIDYHPFVPKPYESKIAGPTAREHARTRMKREPVPQICTGR